MNNDIPQTLLNYNNIQLKCNNDSNINIKINICLQEILNELKQEINTYGESWDIYKKYTNPYEYIHTSYTNKSLCKLKPLSRSFYKMIEIINHFKLDKQFNGKNINTFHLAEGPGGFIEALVYIRNNKNDKYYGMTLVNNDKNVPGWKKSTYFLNNNKNVYIEKGLDNTGDLLVLKNLEYCYLKYKCSMDLITGDGGFDFSVDFNKQEILSLKLIYSQICYALIMQKHGGTFILKMFDIFTEPTIDFLYLLCSLYNNVVIMKPETSRIANSEKYIICKDYKINDDTELYNILIKTFVNVINNDYIHRILNIKIPNYFLNKIEEINTLLGQQQMENISCTFTLIKSNNTLKIDTYKKNNLNKCIKWCLKHNLPINKIN